MNVHSFYTLLSVLMLLVAGLGCKKPSDTHIHSAGCSHNAPASTTAHVHSEKCAHPDAQAAETDNAHDHATEATDEHAHQPGEACEAHDPKHSEHPDSEGPAITIPLSAQKLINITFATAEAREVQTTRRFPGRFEMKPDARRLYSAILEGTVELSVTPNQRVEAGTTLFILQSPAWLRLQGDLRTAEATENRLETEVRLLRERLQRLKEANTRNAELEMSLPLKEADYEQAKVMRTNLVAQGDVIRSQLQVKGHELVAVAKESGIVDAVLATTGQFVQPGTEILSLVRTSGIWFQAEGILSEVQELQHNLMGFVEPLKTRVGTVKPRAEGALTLAWSADRATRTRSLFLTFQNVPDWAIPGMPGVLNVVLEQSRKQALAIPTAALIQDGLEQIVFVRDDHDKNRFIRTRVTVGASDGEYTEVAALHAGDEVVVNGVYELKLATPSATAPTKAAGHFHADGQFHEGNH